MIDRARQSVAPLLTGTAGAALVGAWLLWFFAARVSVYESSLAARLEVATAAHAVDSPLGGRVRQSHVSLGRHVERGDAVVELDTEQEDLAVATARASLGRVEPQIEALVAQQEEEQAALRTQTRASGASVQEIRARLRSSEILARLKNEERVQITTLKEKRLVAPIDADRATAEASQQEARNAELSNAAERVVAEQKIQLSERRARIAALEVQIGQLEQSRAAMTAQIRELTQKASLRIIRAPISGRVGELADLYAGTVVAAGQRLATIVPDGELRVVADYAPAAAVGRIREGLHGRLRLDGFPWTRYGTVDTVVTRVGNESHGGYVRVELAVVRDQRCRIPLEHGLPGVVEIEVAKDSPASLILSLGPRVLGGGAAQ